MASQASGAIDAAVLERETLIFNELDLDEDKPVKSSIVIRGHRRPRSLAKPPTRGRALLLCC